ncbi:ABC transporter permease [Cocleimonas sp. KMM 6892]|uniref:ABC transporter permease n=1 Tax=unclassified Cocleimonas TaxID=2639732 RepID=UPI002DB9E27E|nr:MULTISPECIES: ABC transporter permease [unclassified Cocleimonas]MEB8431078.1 ABC transporter permease [Cocleimonas sp. KMM 6892]MEC4714150.1 ABC transporter permease [Cocleimonas sp. KMM 6895]MEC4743481.1 ABC transporter permease [Cocleimonas sp. KMM 6896]
MLWSSFLLAIKGIRRNLMRSFLTILGVVIGVAAVITMVTLGNGATQAVKDQVSSLGSNLLMIRPGTRMRGPRGDGTPDFKLDDVKAIREQISGLAAVAPQVNKSETVVAMANNWSTSVTGSNNDFFTAGSWSIAEGRKFTDAEETAGQAVCVIGSTIRRELFGTSEVLGENIRVKNFSCQIIGVLKSKGTSNMGQDNDDIVLMPISTVQRRIAGNRDVSGILVSVENESDITRVQTQLTQLMRERRHLTDKEEDNFNILDTRMIAETLSGTTQVMTMLLSAVASVSLLVGGIGIMNIMLVSVTERTREIGIRLAIGALEKEVLLQFLIEAVVLAGLGGIIGIILATITSIILSQVMGVPYTFNVMINLVSFIFSAGIGVLFGFVPARKAARLNPIDALRHE